MVRTKHRWLLVHVHFDSVAENEIGSHEKNALSSTVQNSPNTTNTTPMQLRLLRAIRDSIQHSFGDVGSGALGGAIAIRYYSPFTKHAIFRCSRLGFNQVWASITLCNSLQGKRVRMIVKHCSGTIRKVQQATIRADRKEIERLCIERTRLAKQSASITFAQLQSTQSIDHQNTANTDPIVLDQIAKDALEQSKRDIRAIEQ